MQPRAQVEDCQKSEEFPIRKEEEPALASQPQAPSPDAEALLCVDDFDFLSKLGIERWKQ